MRTRRRLAGILTVVAALGTAACARATEPRTLTSGRVVGLLSSGARHEHETYWLEYCSDGSQADRGVLRAEAAEVFQAFDAALVGYSEVSLNPTDCRWRLRWTGWRPSVVRDESMSFQYVRNAAGEWRAID